MTCNPFSKTASPAVRRYTKGVALTMGGYVLSVFGTKTYANHHPPHGAVGYVLAAIPSSCILAMLGVVAIYLRDEKDEYQRMLVIRSMLIATFSILAIGAYSDFLRAFDLLTALPPFTEFVSFWVIFGLAQAGQSMLGSGDSDE